MAERALASSCVGSAFAGYQILIALCIEDRVLQRSLRVRLVALGYKILFCASSLSISQRRDPWSLVSQFVLIPEHSRCPLASHASRTRLLQLSVKAEYSDFLLSRVPEFAPLQIRVEYARRRPIRLHRLLQRLCLKTTTLIF